MNKNILAYVQKGPPNLPIVAMRNIEGDAEFSGFMNIDNKRKEHRRNSIYIYTYSTSTCNMCFLFVRAIDTLIFYFFLIFCGIYVYIYIYYSMIVFRILCVCVLRSESDVLNFVDVGRIGGVDNDNQVVASWSSEGGERIGAKSFAYSAAISACGKAGQWEKAVSLLDVSDICPHLEIFVRLGRHVFIGKRYENVASSRLRAQRDVVQGSLIMTK